MFYPRISRRGTYRSPSKHGGFYADYRAYAVEISEDCKMRCVYCDARVSENLGGDSFELDHFRPKKHFPHLERDPSNLVLACPACNRFKSAHWPAGTTTSDTFVKGCGFVDPFTTNQLDYFAINELGEISAKVEPASYVIELLSLNRAARNCLRRRRLLLKLQKSLLIKISSKTQRIVNLISNGEIQRDEIIDRLENLMRLQKQLASTLDI
ncbi:HNH endonuclease [Luteolibacter algae]|uniref:HNH endonuclease n=1 Tax=Luteolibacter algae TaxID=454151 RepID=A0ABW5D690_9BACT